MFKKKVTILLMLCVMCYVLCGLASFCSAQSSLVDTIGNCKDTGNCQLNDFMRVVIQASDIILGLVGSLALLMFIYGGVMFLISAGSSERVTQAKQIIIGAVIGLVIVFTSYTIINFTAQALGIQSSGGILHSDWFK